MFNKALGIRFIAGTTMEVLSPKKVSGARLAQPAYLSESLERLYNKLYYDFSDLLPYLIRSDVHEIMLNPDGGLWIDSNVEGLNKVSHLSNHKAFSIINAVAGIHNFVVSAEKPRLEAQLPLFKEFNGERFTAQVPPIVSGPSFSLRKRTESVYTLQDYVATKRMTLEQADILKKLVEERQNILVCGGPGSGKTTVTNALILAAVEFDPAQRFILLEDLPELQCQAQNKVAMLTSISVAMTGLLHAAMRMRPDRILVGEVRGKEALDMLKAWNTGCPGGICTVHANGPEEAIQRILDLSMEAGLSLPPTGLVQHTINAVVAVGRRGHEKGFVESVVLLEKGKRNEIIYNKVA